MTVIDTPVSTRGLSWVAWRQHRTALVASLATVGALALVLLVGGLAMRGDEHSMAMDTCQADTFACQQRFGPFSEKYDNLIGLTSLVAMFMPLLIGSILGGSLLAREYETGTFRFTWTQACGRMRWLRVKLALLVTGVTVVGLAIGWLITWWYGPEERFDNRLEGMNVFDAMGLMFAVHLLFCLAVGAFAGVVIRRVMPAVSVALAVSLAVIMILTPALRANYMPAVEGPIQIATNEWKLDTWWVGPQGQRLTNEQMAELADKSVAELPAKGPAGNAARLLWSSQNHYSPVMSYQPASRFWPFQFIEAGWMLAIAILLGAATIWRVRRSPT
ncbi:ABC transporter permease subunit [Microtetraspora glauca]|uniref:ABC transporter permease subunit n=1 Tax=Microtetraspora glauca TaxID=1996 RepID=A0ABV3GU97_MICGL